jgi:cellulose synthase/poly-beta-1,6-N-acetylglucosamine synthase-like glycosyltransferase
VTLVPDRAAAAPRRPETVAVVVPTYRRPDDRRRCLAALAAQTRPPDVVVVVVRRDDTGSIGVIAAHDALLAQLRTVCVDAPGQVHALNSGLDAADADIVAITDDDAAPRPDWIRRLLAAFAADPQVGAVGGRDWVHHGGRTEDGAQPVVGRLLWHGHCIGNHHLGVGAPRDVDFLKGANMSYRRAAIAGVRFDGRLRGAGAQVCNDMAFSLAVRRQGWRVVYDPSVAVDHYPAVRFDDDRRNAVSPAASFNAAFNQALVSCEAIGPARAAVYLAWAIVIGTRASPGLLQLVRLAWRERTAALVRAGASMRGSAAGWCAAMAR